MFVALGVEELSEGLGGWQEGGESQQPAPTPVQAAVGSHPQTAMPFVAQPKCQCICWLLDVGLRDLGFMNGH